MSKKILIVEDDEAIAKLYQTELQLKGFSVQTAPDGQSGYDLTINENFDLILLDIMMPVLNGIDTLKKLRENDKTKSVPVLMLTNFGQESLVKEAFNVGATDYVLKYQITPSELTERVYTLLGIKGQTWLDT